MAVSLQYFDVTIEKIIIETPAIRTFVLKRPKDFTNLPGQFSWLTLPSLRIGNDFPKTPMAIGSGIDEKELFFSFRDWGYLTKKFFELQKGDKLSISQPLGSSLPLDIFKTSNILCIAGGTGIVPIRSFITSFKSSKHLELLYGARTPSELLYKDQIKHWNSHIIVERSDENKPWKGPLGFVTNLITEDSLAKYQYCYVCGPLPMMQNTILVLRKIGFTPEKIWVSIEKMENNEVIGPVFPVSDPNVQL